MEILQFSMIYFLILALFLAHFGPIVLVYLKTVLNGCLFIFFPNIVKT